MKTLSTPETFREKLYSSLDEEMTKRMDELLIRSVWGSNRLSGIDRALESYMAKSPRDLPRIPKEDR